MRCHHQHMTLKILQLICLRIPPLIKITSMNPVKLLRTAYYIGSMAPEKTVHIHISPHIYRISQKLGQHGTYQFLSVELHSLFRIISGDIPIRSVRLFVHIKNFPHNCRFPGFFHKLLCMDSFHQDLLKPITIRRLAAHAKTFLTSGIICVADTLLNSLTFQLRKHNADI